MTQAKSAEVGPLFDADNHYWETSEAFTRHREPKFRDRGIQVKEIDGVVRYVLDGEIMPVLPGPADIHPRAAPGALLGLFSGHVKAADWSSYFNVSPADRPEWYNRDRRLAVMDEQKLDACWMFPSQAVVIEAPMLATGDIEASDAVMRAFNRWLDEDWGFAYKNRIFAAPHISLSDPNGAVAELEWVLSRGARVINLRHGAAVTREGLRSPAHVMFDRFWGLVQESGITVAFHGSADRTYDDIHASLVSMYGETPDGSVQKRNRMALISGSIFDAMTKGRQVQDFAFILVAHRLFERFPKLRVAFVEAGSAWVPSLLRALENLDHGGHYAPNPCEQFIEHCWVAPYPEEDVMELARHLPAKRILFGSDWPHGEGFATPSDFVASLAAFSYVDRRQILYNNAAELTGCAHKA